MADIALGSVGKIIDIGLKINEAVQDVKQNEKECRDIEKCVARVTRIIDCFSQTVKRFDEVSPATEAIHKDNNISMHDALEDLAESLEGALELVIKCQQKHVVRRFIGARNMAKQLRLVQDDILRKVTVGSFASSALQIGITLRSIIAQAAPPLQPQNRSQIDEINRAAEGVAIQSDPLSGLTKFNFTELQDATNDFSYDSNLPTGHFKLRMSNVFKGYLRNGQVVAIKDLDHDSDNYELSDMLFSNELFTGVKLQHKNVVKTLGYCIDDHAVSFPNQEEEEILPRHILVIGYLPNGTLKDMLEVRRQFHWPFHFRTILGIAQGLHYLHEQNVVHRDLKPENIMYDWDMNPVIIDFGLSVVLDNGVDMMTTDQIDGTVGHMAPEFIGDGVVSKKNDLFAFGAILQKCVEACANFEYGSDCESELENVDYMRAMFDPTHVEESELMNVARCLKLALMCMEFEPADRPTMVDVLDMLNGEKEVPARKNKPPIDSSSGEE